MSNSHAFDMDPSMCSDNHSSVLKALDRLQELDPIPTRGERIRLLNWGRRRGLIEYPDGLDPHTCMIRGAALEEALERGAPDPVIARLGGWTDSDFARERQRARRARLKEDRKCS